MSKQPATALINYLHIPSNFTIKVVTTAGALTLALATSKNEMTSFIFCYTFFKKYVMGMFFFKKEFNLTLKGKL